MQLKTSLLLAVALLGSVTSPLRMRAQDLDAGKERIRSMIRKELGGATQLPSMAVAVVHRDAIVWEEVVQRTGEESRLSVTFLLFLSIATIIAGIGVLLDQPILIVGAMVVGPEFGPLAAFCVGVVRRRPPIIARAALALVVGFIVVSIVLPIFDMVQGYQHR